MSNYTPFSASGYTRLSIDERDQIAGYRSQKMTISEIARALKRHKSTICRELKRNQPPVNNVCYHAVQAHRRSVQRQSSVRQKERLADMETRFYIVEKIKLGWTPQLIAGRISTDLPGHSTNHESIYQYIYEVAPGLRHHLPRGYKKRRKRGQGAGKHKSKIPNRVPIDQRPDLIGQRVTFGHWEVDTMVSRASPAALAVMVERKTRHVLIKKINQKTAAAMESALKEKLGSLKKKARKTITYDNGLENVHHEAVNKFLGTKSYFCQPYHSWEKGSVENIIGLIRRYLPKKTNLAKITENQIASIEQALNSRPRKVLGFKTPYEVFVALAG